MTNLLITESYNPCEIGLDNIFPPLPNGFLNLSKLQESYNPPPPPHQESSQKLSLPIES